LWRSGSGNGTIGRSLWRGRVFIPPAPVDPGPGILAVVATAPEMRAEPAVSSCGREGEESADTTDPPVSQSVSAFQRKGSGQLVSEKGIARAEETDRRTPGVGP
jgi:hypothetical protein